MGVHANETAYDDFDRPDSIWRLALVVGRPGAAADRRCERLGRTNVEMRSALLVHGDLLGGVPGALRERRFASGKLTVRLARSARRSSASARGRRNDREPGRRRLAPAAAFQFAFIAAVALLKPGANALVLARYHARRAAVALHGGGGHHRGLAAWTAVSGRAGAGAAARAGAGGRGGGGGLRGWRCGGRCRGLTPLARTSSPRPSRRRRRSSFWGAMGEAFDAREARRAFTWINGVGMSGAIVGGALAQVRGPRGGRRWRCCGAAAALLALGGRGLQPAPSDAAQPPRAGRRWASESFARRRVAPLRAARWRGWCSSSRCWRRSPTSSFARRRGAELKEQQMADALRLQPAVDRRVLRRLPVLRRRAAAPAPRHRALR